MQRDIKVIILSDYLLLSDGIERIIEKEKDIFLIGKAQNVPDAIEFFNKLVPNVILMDFDIHASGGQRIIQYLWENKMSSKVLLLTNEQDEDTLISNFSIGIHGCLSKCASSEDMIKAIRAVYSEEIWIKRGLMSRFISDYSRSARSQQKLTPRENEIAQLIVQGLSNKEIASRLFISDKTVKSHITRAFTKMGVDNRVKLTIRMLPYGR